jgi:hypothetical protein
MRLFLYSQTPVSLYTQENGEKVEGRADKKILDITIIANQNLLIICDSSAKSFIDQKQLYFHIAVNLNALYRDINMKVTFSLTRNL